MHYCTYFIKKLFQKNKKRKHLHSLHSKQNYKRKFGCLFSKKKNANNFFEKITQIEVNLRKNENKGKTKNNTLNELLYSMYSVFIHNKN